MPTIKITARARVFSGEGIRKYGFCVDLRTGDVKAWDTIAGHYTRCALLSAASQKRLVKLALAAYAEQEIVRRDLGDSATNCHGVIAQTAKNGVRLTDGNGLDVVCRTIEEVDRELAEITGWYAESDQE